MFVLEIQSAVAARRKTVDGLGTLLEWLKKVFRLVFSNPEAITLMPCITSGLDFLSSLSFPLVMTNS